MKLNPDCIRDILIAVESLPNANYHSRFDEYSIPNEFPNYTYDEVMYHIRQCELSGFFYKASGSISGSYDVHDLSPLGHQFLADIRSDTIWSKTKSIAHQIGSNSLDTLIKISTGVLAELIKQQLN